MVKLKVEKLHNQTQWILSKFVLNYSQLVMSVSQWGLVHTEITSKYEIRNNGPLNKHLMYEKRNANLRMLFTATAWTKPCCSSKGSKSAVTQVGANQSGEVPRMCWFLKGTEEERERGALRWNWHQQIMGWVGKTLQRTKPPCTTF